MIINTVIQTILLLFMTLGNNEKNISLTNFECTSLHNGGNCAHDNHYPYNNSDLESQLLLDEIDFSRLNVETIVLDAGHGGKDHGCSGKRSKEKEVVLDVVLKLG